jgi:drug/metabolite transporter (DMT)-like permease
VVLFGELAGLATALSWAITTLLVRGEGKRAHLLVLGAVVATTAAVCTLLLLVVSLALGQYAVAIGPRPAAGLAFLLAAVVLNVGGDTLLFVASQRIGVARAMPVSMCYPLLTTLLAALFVGEHVSPGLAAGLVLIPSGLYLVTLPSRGRVVLPQADTRALRLGVAMALAAAVSWSVAVVCMRPALEQIDPVTASVVRTSVGALLTWLIAWRGAALVPGGPTARPRLPIGIAAGLFYSAAAILANVAVQHAGAARTSTLIATTPLFAVPFSALLLGEHVSRRMLVGTILSVTGVALVIGF